MIEARVLVVGAGAIGGVTAAKMTGNVRRVSVLDADPEHVRLARDPGLLLDDLGERRRVPLDAYDDPAAVEGPFDFALIIVKAPHLEAAILPLLERELAETYVSIGNGLVQEWIADLVGAASYVPGVVEFGATNLGPGRVAQTTRGPFVVGELDGGVRERTRLLRDALATVDGAKVSEDIRGQIWSKLLVNSTFSGLGAVSGTLYRDAVADPNGRDAALALWKEGYDVGVAQDLKMDRVLDVRPEELVVRGPGDEERADRALATAMERAGATRASMLQDLERGAQTEVDVINGGVVRKGAETGVPTALNARVVELVQAMERGERLPGPDALAELAELALGSP